MVSILFIFLIGLAIEVFFAANKIRMGISPKAQFWLRVLMGIVCNLVFIHSQMPYLFETFKFSFAYMRLFEDDLYRLLALQFALIFTYWNLFDGFLNLARGLNWFRWGKTKVADRFFGQHPGLQMLGHFLKWAVMVGGVLSLIN